MRKLTEAETELLTKVATGSQTFKADALPVIRDLVSLGLVTSLRRSVPRFPDNGRNIYTRNQPAERVYEYRVTITGDGRNYYTTHINNQPPLF